MGDDKAKGGKDTGTKRVIQIDVQTPLPQKGNPFLLAGFEVDKFHLSCPDKDKKYNHCMLLNDMISWINKPSLNISIIGMEGRASETGPWNNNYYLSKRRVEEVQKYLRTHGKINVKNIRFLGQKYPLDRPAGPGPNNLEIDTNRSVRIYIRRPPVAIARVIGENNQELNRRTAYYYPNSNSVSPEFITLDGKKSYPCEGFPIVSYLWEHIGTRIRAGANSNEVVELLPWHSSSVKATESDYNPSYEESRKKYRGMSDHDVVKFRLDTNLLDVLCKYNTIVLTFRLTVIDVDNLKDSTTVDVTITPISLRRNIITYEWGLKMVGSVSLKALKLGVGKDVSVKGVSVGINASAGVGGVFAIGVLKRYSDNSEKYIVFFGLGVGVDFKGGAKTGINTAALTDPRRLAKIRRLKDLLGELDITIDDQNQEFTKFHSSYSTFEEFDSNNAEMRNFDLHAPVVGHGWGYIQFLDTKIYPSGNPDKVSPSGEIDIGGPLTKNTTMLGVDYQKSIYGKVYTFSPEDFVDELLEKIF